jgi:AcrR family transcriptional regulator
MKPEKRQQIMDAAEALFSRFRFHEITMDAVAHEAGVGKGTIYRYFADKEELYFEVAMSGHDALCESVEAEAASEGCFREKLVRVCETVSNFFQQRHRVWHLMQAEDRRQLMQQGGRHEAWMNRRNRLQSAMAGVLETAAASGQLRPDIPIPLLVACLRGMLRARAHETRMDEGSASVPTSVMVDLFLNGAGVGSREVVE